MRAVLSGVSAFLGFGILLATQVLVPELAARTVALVDVAILLILVPIAAETALAFLGNLSLIDRRTEEFQEELSRRITAVCGDINDAKVECDERFTTMGTRFAERYRDQERDFTDRLAQIETKLFEGLTEKEDGLWARSNALASLINERASKADVAKLNAANEEIAGELRKIQHALLSQATNQQAGGFGPTGNALEALANRAGIKR